MSRPLAKPSSDPLIGSRVLILRGLNAGKQGRVVKAYRDRPATADRVMLELDGSLPGWGITCPPVEDVEVVD